MSATVAAPDDTIDAPPPPLPPGTSARAIDKDTLRELMQPSLWKWSIRVAGDWMLVVVPMLIAGYTRHWAAFAFAVVMSGIAQHRIAIMAHEGTHRQASRNKRFNDFLTGAFCLWPFGNPVGGYRRFHFTHHRHLNTEQDCELHQKRKSAPAWDLPATPWKVFKYFVRDVCLLHVMELARLSRRVRPGIDLADGASPNLWMLAVAVPLIYFGHWWVIVVWYLGTAMVFWPTFRLRVWTEHVGTHESHRISAPWYIRFWVLPHHTYCHYEHHYYPQVPCWNLPKVRALMGDTPPIVPVLSLFEVWKKAPPLRSGEPYHLTAEAMPGYSPVAIE